MTLREGVSDSPDEEGGIAVGVGGGSMTGVPAEGRLSFENSVLISVIPSSRVAGPFASPRSYFIERLRVAVAAEGTGVALGLNVGVVVSDTNFRSINLALPLIPANT